MVLYVVNLCPTISLNSEVLNNICSRQILELGFVKDKYLLFWLIVSMNYHTCL